MKYVHLIWVALTRRKLRTLLTLISIAVAFLLFGLLESVSSVFTQAGNSIEAAHRLITVSKASFMAPLPLSLQARLPTVPGVHGVTYASLLPGTYQSPRNPIVAVAVARNYFDLHPEFQISAAARRAFDDTQTGAIVGAALAERYHWKVGDQIPIKAMSFPRKDRSDTWSFNLKGIYRAEKSAEEQGFFIQWNDLDLSRIFDQGTVGLYIEDIAEPDQAGRIAAKLDALSANSDHETRTQTESAFAAGFVNQIVDLGLLVNSIMGAVFFTVILVAGNTMAQAVRERVPEIGVLKTLGFSNGSVLGLVLAESVLLVALGGVVGLTLAAGVVDALQAQLGSQLPMMPVNAAIWLRGIGVMALIGLLIGALPAQRGMRLRIVDALAGR